MSWNAYPAPEDPLPPDAEQLPHVPAQRQGQTPTILEMVAFFTMAAILITLLQALSAAVVIHWHLFGRITLRQLVYQPRFTIPAMMVSYGVVALATVALYRRVWPDGFLAGIHWNFSQVRRHALWLPALGIGLGFAMQLASNYLPIPKELPVDSFFQNALDAWMVALFGVFIAPICEEIAFRGFLYPSLRPWTGRILAAILTSVPFAFLHAQQVAHAWGPLSLVFLVSMVLVWVRDRTNSVACSALVHACYNFSIFAAIFYASGGFQHLEHLKD
ncbi:MAG TPA: type II CAAX endopeptidase family protein [Acidobacteriaceae bacterium]|nr:type II CAAX endopeptidase family protein [Acidobacteriaceae bacterium]